MLNQVRDMEYFYCRKSHLVMLKYKLSMLKYLLNKQKYPLFSIGSGKGGTIESRRLLKRMKVRKFVRYRNHYYFSLSVPHWPSRAFDNMVAKGGLNIAAAGTPFKRQIDNAIIGITRRCSYKCLHCYEQFNLGEKDSLGPGDIIKVIKKLQDYGVSIITLSGGEPMSRFSDLMGILESSDHNISDFHIHTSGNGVTAEKAKALKKAGLQAAGIGLDDVDPSRNDKFRGSRGAFARAVSAIGYFLDAGIFTYVNTCLTNDLIQSGDLSRYFDLMKSLDIGFVRWLEPKPTGALLSGKEECLLTPENRAIATDLYIRANMTPAYHNYPVISYEAYMEAPENLGCIMGGNSLIYIDTVGNVLPCVFMQVTFGNILGEDFSEILSRMRKAFPAPLRTACPSVLLNQQLQNHLSKGISSFPLPFEEIRQFLAL